MSIQQDAERHIDGSVAGRTARKAAFPYCVVARFEDGVIVEFHESFDRLEMLGQLGLLS